MMSMLGTQRQELIRALRWCASASEHCASSAVGMVDKEECVETCMDAASLCRVAAELVARTSPYEVWVVPLSILAAQACANQCDLHSVALFTECAEAGRAVVAAVDNIAEERPMPMRR